MGCWELGTPQHPSSLLAGHTVRDAMNAGVGRPGRLPKGGQGVGGGDTDGIALTKPWHLPQTCRRQSTLLELGVSEGRES